MEQIFQKAKFWTGTKAKQNIFGQTLILLTSVKAAPVKLMKLIWGWLTLGISHADAYDNLFYSWLKLVIMKQK